MVGLSASDGTLKISQSVDTSVPGRYEILYQFVGLDEQVIFSVSRFVIVEGGNGFFGATANGQPRIAMLDNPQSGYSRLVQDVTLQPGIHDFRIIADKYVCADDAGTPGFFWVNPSSAAKPSAGAWELSDLEGGWVEMKRQLTVSEAFSGALVVSARNNLPRKFQLIELRDNQGNEVLQDSRFESDDFGILMEDLSSLNRKATMEEAASSPQAQGVSNLNF